MPFGWIFHQVQGFTELIVFGRIGNAAAGNIFVFVFFRLIFIGFGFCVGRRFVAAVDVLAAQRITDMADQIGFAAFKGAVFVFNFNVRDNALCLNRAVVRRVVQRGGQFDCAATGSGIRVCTEPLPKLCVPTTTARLWSCNAPATISEAEAEPALIRTVIGMVFSSAGNPANGSLPLVVM